VSPETRNERSPCMTLWSLLPRPKMQNADIISANIFKTYYLLRKKKPIDTDFLIPERRKTSPP